jgi:hypothetical protein
MILNLFILEKGILQTRMQVPRNLGVQMKKRRYNALKRAYDRLIENPYINYENGKMLILSDSVTNNSEAKFYRTSRQECRLEEPGNVLCHAFWDGYPCWHQATARDRRKLSPDRKRRRWAEGSPTPVRYFGSIPLVLVLLKLPSQVQPFLLKHSIHPGLWKTI